MRLAHVEVIFKRIELIIVRNIDKHGLLKSLVEQLCCDAILRADCQRLVERDDGPLGLTVFQVDQSLGAQYRRVFTAETQDLVELLERITPPPETAVGMGQIRASRKPSAGVGINLAGDLYRAKEEANGLLWLVLVILDNAHLVQKEGICLAEPHRISDTKGLSVPTLGVKKVCLGQQKIRVVGEAVVCR
ncbi:hypothetical protein HYQ46_001393 [Verticillium longisporum]|nr:hypothetical protein HYQ46_001393 [Verticillium longisporum]